jgi:hypothetical protein
LFLQGDASTRMNFPADIGHMLEVSHCMPKGR